MSLFKYVPLCPEFLKPPACMFDRWRPDGCSRNRRIVEAYYNVHERSGWDVLARTALQKQLGHVQRKRSQVVAPVQPHQRKHVRPLLVFPYAQRTSSFVTQAYCTQCSMAIQSPSCVLLFSLYFFPSPHSFFLSLLEDHASSARSHCPIRTSF
jgi:hypothetical protein